MFRHAARLTTVLIGVTATGVLLVGAPADAREATSPAPTSPVPLPVAFPCLNTWTNIIVGNPFEDVLYGTTENDLMIGFGGDDYIYGDRGRDTILGGDGNDTLDGAQGNDCIYGGAGDDESVIHQVIMSSGTDDSSSVAYKYDY